LAHALESRRLVSHLWRGGEGVPRVGAAIPALGVVTEAGAACR